MMYLLANTLDPISILIAGLAVWVALRCELHPVGAVVAAAAVTAVAGRVIMILMGTSPNFAFSLLPVAFGAALIQAAIVTGVMRLVFRPKVGQ